MAHRRILSLWFPRLGAERMLRGLAGALPEPFAVVADQGGAQVLTSLNPEAMAAGLRPGQPLRDATAMCPALITRTAQPLADAAFLTALRRWAGRFSPWVAEEPPATLVIDITGCAHLFGGELAMLAHAQADCAELGLTVQAGLADTPGAAWALARYATRGPGPDRNGDAIAQEARATRSRAAKRRHWERGGAAPLLATPTPPQSRVAPPGQTRQVLAPLPIAALRLPPDTVGALARLGLRRVEDLMTLPRAALARRFGTHTLRRLDQALGVEPEPVTPARAPLHFAARLSFPDPIGTGPDIAAGLERLLPPVCGRLAQKGRGARRVRLQAFRADGHIAMIEVGLARPSSDPARIRPLLALKLDQIDPGFGIDTLRLEATETEPLPPHQHRGPIGADPRPAADTALDDLIGKLGARLGADAVTRLHPAESHIPERSALILAAAWSTPATPPWPEPRAPRPLQLFRPEPVSAPEDPRPPRHIRWRRRDLTLAAVSGPERIAPEWWLDDPEWRSGPRDYWQADTNTGDRLWLFYAHGADLSPGWFCHGEFA